MMDILFNDYIRLETGFVFGNIEKSTQTINVPIIPEVSAPASLLPSPLSPATLIVSPAAFLSSSVALVLVVVGLASFLPSSSSVPIFKCSFSLICCRTGYIMHTIYKHIYEFISLFTLIISIIIAN